jgi:hypothetical protein
MYIKIISQHKFNSYIENIIRIGCDDDMVAKVHSLKMILGLLLIFLSLGFIISGGVILFLNITKTDSDGYALSNTVSIKSSAYAFVLWLDREPGGSGQLKFIVTSANSSKELFVGYAKETEANTYIQGTEYANPSSPPGQLNYDWEIYNAKLSWASLNTYGKIGVAPSSPPSAETFWLQKSQITGTATIYWEPVRELNAPRTLIVIMNSDGSRNIQAEIVLGYKLPMLGWIPYLLISVGLLMGIIGVTLLTRTRATILS